MDNLRGFIIFITIALMVYSGINAYIYARIIQSAALSGFWGGGLKAVLLLLILAFPLSRIFGSHLPGEKTLIWIGSLWLGVMFYGFIIVLIVDIFRLVNYIIPFHPSFMMNNPLQTGRIILAGGALAMAVLLIAGYINSLHPAVKEYVIPLKGLHPSVSEYRIVVFSDLHLGALVGKARLEKVVEKVNRANPDLCVIAGDLFDESLTKVEWASEPLSKIKARDGVFAVTGNHEYYIGVEKAVGFMEKAGITVLRNRAVEIGGFLTLAGLNDATGASQRRDEQIPISGILGNINPHLPVIMMHHTPIRLNEAASAGVSLMITGHTHNGQLWPAGYIAHAVYKLAPGLSIRGGMYVLNSSGAGTWGPPARIGSTPEISLLSLIPGE